MQKGLLGACVAVVLAAVGCQDQAVTAPSRAASRGPAAQVAQAPAGLKIDRSRNRLPAGAVDLAYDVRTQRAINPDNYQCPGWSPFTDWYWYQTWPAFVEQSLPFWNLLDLAADQLPQYEALLLGEPGKAQQFFGYTGEFTNALIRTEKDVKNFWDIPSSNIRMVGVHGTMLSDSARVDRAYQVVYGVPAGDAAVLAGATKANLAAATLLNGGNNPLFSFNAFAYPAYRDETTSFSPAIVLGDGILEGYAAVGFGDVAPQAIYAHEFGHHVQFANGYFKDPIATTGDRPERTRYTELMADAYAGYFLTHSRGAALNRKRVAEFLQIFYQTGDCAFEAAGHHGTPNQRMAAARFGFDVADEARKQGQILTSAQFHDRFVAVYARLVAPDAAPVVAAQ